jgi:hypothetical protein
MLIIAYSTRQIQDPLLEKSACLGYSNAMEKRILALFCAVLMTAGAVWAQSASAAQQDEQLSFVGMKLDEVYRRFGPPQAVYAARGEENWQDDVVFVYNEGDFYIYRDRVWQVGVKSIYGMRIGDARGVALLVLGENARDGGDYVLYPLPGGAWPLSLRVNLNAGRISSIFIYRPDY